MIVSEIRKRLKKLGSLERAATLQRFFKTGPGEYGEGDRFLGIRVPEIRKLAREYRDLATEETEKFLVSPVHEERLFALLILVDAYSRGGASERKRIYELYLSSTKYINNWDLVDVTAEHIVGAYLDERSRKPLYQLVNSKDLWERRIAIMATFRYIKNGELDETLELAEHLLDDAEDLIHKAVGWMLREVGKRDLPAEERFLEDRYKRMPRTMLRYAIEKFPEPVRRKYLKGKI